MSFDLPNLPDGWEYRPLNECALGGSITYGVVQPGTAQAEGIPLVRVNNFRDGRLDLTDFMKISPDIESKYSRTRLKGGEVLLTLVGSVGQVAIAPESVAGFNVARAVGVIHPISEIGPEWISACLRSPASQSLLISRANTTVQTTINLKDVRALPIPIPPKGERDEIARVISTLDDRIALLRETNITLEAIAQALFKSWFVDFDPVRAKAEGCEPEGLASDTAVLFPDGFEESELGLVPRGWSTRSIYDISTVVYGAPFASKRFNSDQLGRPLIRIRDLKDESPGVHTDEIHPKGYMVQPGDIVVGMDGEFRAYLWGGEAAWLNQRVCVFKPVDDMPSAFIHLSIKPLLAAVEASETATTVIHLGKNDIDRFRVRVPSLAVLEAFSSAAKPMYDKLVLNKQTISSLAGLRDSLLPRLISGKLRIPEAAEILETV